MTLDATQILFSPLWSSKFWTSKQHIDKQHEAEVVIGFPAAINFTLLIWSMIWQYDICKKNTFIFSSQMKIILPFHLECVNKAEKLCLTQTSCSVFLVFPQVRLSSWPKETPGSWFSEFKRGKMVSLFFSYCTFFCKIWNWRCDKNNNL